MGPVKHQKTRMHRQKTVKSAAQRLAVHQHLQIANKWLMGRPRRGHAQQNSFHVTSTGTRTPVPTASHARRGGSTMNTRPPRRAQFPQKTPVDPQRRHHPCAIIRRINPFRKQYGARYGAPRTSGSARLPRSTSCSTAWRMLFSSMGGMDPHAFKIPERIDEYAAVHHRLAVGGTAAEGIVQRSIFHTCAPGRSARPARRCTRSWPRPAGFPPAVGLALRHLLIGAGARRLAQPAHALHPRQMAKSHFAQCPGRVSVQNNEIAKQPRQGFRAPVAQHLAGGRHLTVSPGPRQ